MTVTQLFQGLPQLDCDSKIALDANITFKEVTAAVGNLNIGRSLEWMDCQQISIRVSGVV